LNHIKKTQPNAEKKIQLNSFSIEKHFIPKQIQSKLDHLQIIIWLEYIFLVLKECQQLNTTTTTEKPLRNLFYFYFYFLGKMHVQLLNFEEVAHRPPALCF
jgi:hypothetical protein